MDAGRMFPVDVDGVLLVFWSNQKGNGGVCIIALVERRHQKGRENKINSQAKEMHLRSTSSARSGRFFRCSSSEFLRRWLGREGEIGVSSTAGCDSMFLLSSAMVCVFLGGVGLIVEIYLVVFI